MVAVAVGTPAAAPVATAGARRRHWCSGWEASLVVVAMSSAYPRIRELAMPSSNSATMVRQDAAKAAKLSVGQSVGKFQSSLLFSFRLNYLSSALPQLL